MGLSSSQARLLHLTTRMHQIEYKAAKLEAEKLQMANESSRAYETYLNELERTKIQYSALSPDGSITYQDASYLDLMSGNSGTPYLLYTTGSEKVCLSEELVSIYNSSSSADDFAKKLKNYRSNGSAGSATWWHDDNNGNTPAINPINPVIPPNQDPDPPTPPIQDPNPPTPPVEEPPAQNNDLLSYTITRGADNAKSVNVTSEGINLKVANLINDDGSTSTYSYTIKSNGTSSNATFKILDNGRLYIDGDGLTVDANGGQKDNIILNGNNNVINTYDGDDTVRVGITNDSRPFDGGAAVVTSGNVINTGDGNDYVQNCGRNTFNLGNGTDSYYTYVDPRVASGTYSSAENIFAASTAIDNRDGWAQQNQYGDCKLLALLNSLTGCTNSGSLTNFVNITKTGSNYNVQFRNGDSTTVSQSQIDGDPNRVNGDMDVIVVEQAIKNVLGSDFYNLGSSPQVSERVAGLLLGQEKYVQADLVTGNDLANKQFLFNSLWDMYDSNQISNLIVAWGSNSEENGIVTNHAYAVKNVVKNSYVDVVNPWDDRDTIRLDWGDFMNYLECVVVFGNDVDELNDLILMNSINESPDKVLATLTASENIQEIDAGMPTDDLTALYYVIGQAIATNNYELIPGDMVNNKSFLVNAIQSGAVYLKEPDKTSGKWVGTSVAVATKLREVSDETNLKKAEAQYEADMKKIDRKDRKYDQDLSALEAERNAVKNEMETLKTVAKDNVDRTFKLFS